METKNKKEEELTLETLFTDLDEVVEKMESGDTTLEESFQLYQKGISMLKQCNEKIDLIEKQVLILEENGDLHEF
ncbi:MAG: exodeoxyribonuclease VII small subunit [bacterium]|nr:exodeoxyribonuclease VII small subunit [bacterium]